MRLLLPLLAAGCLLAALPIAATARDSGAPPGASHRWLPCEDWVMYHWLPYSERRLVRLLRLEPGLVEPRRAGASQHAGLSWWLDARIDKPGAPAGSTASAP